MKQYQLKEIAELIDLDIDKLILCKTSEDKQYLLDASYNKQKDSFAKHNKTFNSINLAKEKTVDNIEPFNSILDGADFNFIHSIDSYHKDTYLIISIDDLQRPEAEQKLIEDNIKLTINNYFLNKKLETQETKYQAYLQEVKTIKEKLLPAAGHTIEGLDYATYYEPNVGGGGDYFDIMDLRAARRRAGYEDSPLFWGVGLMDVSGHGPGAAVEVAMVDAILRTYQGKIGSGPGDVVTYLNKHFFTRQFRGGFGTCFLCNYDTSTRIFSYASAGHLPILVKHKDGTVSVIASETGIPIGVEREHEWETEKMELNPGDTIVLFTDGITEAESVIGEQFGLDRLSIALENSEANSAKELMSDFMSVFNQHIKGVDEHDDQTLIMLTISCCDN